MTPARFLLVSDGVVHSVPSEPTPDTADAPLRQFGGAKHARYHEADVVYHGLIRTIQGRFLLRPDDKRQLATIIAGVMGRAQLLYPSVRLYADAWMSNHAHLLISGCFREVPAFFGFIQREISRRWGQVIGWDGPMFQRFQTTALPSEESQLRALRYVLAQSTKEHLVTSPLQWPGVHCAKDLVRAFVRSGTWFDGTGYGRELHRRRARKTHRTPPHRRDFERRSITKFEKLPALAHLSDRQYRAHIGALIRQIETTAADERQGTGRPVVGRRKVLRLSREVRFSLPEPPWFERRRRMICWADRRARETVRYLRRYWEFQREFREASREFLAGDLTAAFPLGAFRPGSSVPVSTASD